MNARWPVGLVLVVTVLVVTSQPAAAATVTLGEHTTFGTGDGEPDPTTLNDVSVSGTGSSASVQYNGETRLSYNPEADEGDGGSDRNPGWAGTDFSGDPMKSEFRIQPTFSGTIDEVEYTVGGIDGDRYTPTVDVYIVQETPDQTFGEGTKVASFEADPNLGTHSFEFDTAYSVTAGKNYTIEFVTTETQRDGDRIQLDADGSASSQWYYYSDALETVTDVYADITVIDPAVDGRYVGASYDASQLVRGETELSLTNTSATITWQEDADADNSWTNVTSTTVTNGGTITSDLSTTQADRWRVRIDFTATGQSPSANLDAERILSNNEAPVGSNLDPTGQLGDYDGDVSIDVEDPDFATAQGDEVDVQVEDGAGNVIGSTTLVSNGTATIEYSSAGGTNDLTWTLTDSYGESDTVSQSFTAPSNLTIKNESAPSQPVDLSSDVEVRFYFDIDGDPEVYNRSVQNGNVSLNGLPVDRPFTVVVSGDGNYLNRRIFVESLYERQTVYLLPKNATSVPVIFDVGDFSGRFDQRESALLVQRAIDGRWETVEGDLIGANERVSARLRIDARHRLAIVNAQTGDRDILGPYTPVGSGEQTIQVTAQNELVVQGLDGFATIGPDIGVLAPRTTTINSSVRAQETSIDIATLTITATDENGSTATLATVQRSSAGGLNASVDLSPYPNGTVSAVTTFNTSDGRQGQVSKAWDIRDPVMTDVGILAVLGDVDTVLPQNSVGPFQLAAALLLTLITTTAAAAKARLPTEATATLGLLQLGVWGAIGWIPWTIPFAAGVGAVGIAALRRGI